MADQTRIDLPGMSENILIVPAKTWQADIQADGATLRERVWSILEEERAAERPDPTLIAALTAALALPDAGEDKLTLSAPTFFIPKRVCEGAPTRDGMCDRCGIENASKASIHDPRCLSFNATPADTPPALDAYDHATKRSSRPSTPCGRRQQP